MGFAGVDKRLTRVPGSSSQLFLSCTVAMIESVQSYRAAVPAGPGRGEGAVKRDVYQFRPLSWFVIFLPICLILLLAASVPAIAQEPSGPDENPAAKGDQNPSEEAKVPAEEAEAPAEEAKAPEEAKASDEAKTSDEAKAKDVAKAKEDVKKDTPGFAVKPPVGLHMDVDLALINVTVTDPYNRLVTGLDPDNFRVYEDNIEQEVVTFSSEDVPISIGVIFDFSGSMANKIGKAREAALQFFKTANPQDEFFLVSFNERAELTSAFTNSIEDLQSRMMLTAPKGRTALLDAIYLGLSQMRGARNGKRALLILSDGGDNHSRYNESDIKRLVKEADTHLYAIGI